MLGDYYIKTRRYDGAEEILKQGLDKYPEYSKTYNWLLDELDKRRKGKENGGKPEYMPNPKENADEVRRKYVDFLASIGIEAEVPVKGAKKSESHPNKLSSYPELLEIRKAGFKSFVAYDVETTGLNRKFDSIIEIGAVRVTDGVITDKFQMFAKPYKCTVKPEITAITGITKDMVKDAPEMWDMFCAFADFIGDDILVGYNNVSFDNKFITRAGKYAGRIINNQTFDVLRFAKDMKNAIKYNGDNMTLADLSDFLSIENPQAHRALADAETTAKIYLKLLEYNKDTSETLDDLFSGFDDM